MSKGLELGRAHQAAASQAKASVSSTHLRPVSTRRQHAAFKGVRPSVRVLAAEPEAAPAATATPAARGKRADKEYAVKLDSVKPGDEFDAKVVSVEEFGAFVDFGASKNGLVHISQLADQYVKNAKEFVKAGQEVKVKVMTLDIEKGKIALTMKGLNGSSPASESTPAPEYAQTRSFAPRGDAAPAVDDEEEDQVELEEGEEEVRSDLKGFEDLPFVMDEDDEEMTDASLAALEADLDNVEVVYEVDAPPYLEAVTGTVVGVEDNVLVLEFQFQGQTVTGYLPKDELKVPTSLLSEEQQAAVKAAWAEEDDAYSMPAYSDMGDEDFQISTFYKAGDEVPAFVLDGGLDGQGVTLTQFTDEDITNDLLDLAAEEGADDEETEDLVQELQDFEAELAAVDPEELMGEEEEIGAGAGEGEEEDDEDPYAAYYEEEGGEAEVYLDEELADGANKFSQSYRMGTDGKGLIRAKNGQYVTPLGLPNREVYVNPENVAIVDLKDTDFDGDEIKLEDYWASNFVIPKGALKRAGLKMVFDDKGESEIIEREDAELQLGSPDDLIRGSAEERAAEYVRDLLDDDEDEAELPFRMARRPVVLAVSVQSISASTVKELRDKTGAGMMDCKKALTENDGDMDKASEWLRKKGLSGADKKAGRLASEGAIVRYIHPGSRLGVLLEVNCETDFVAVSDKFQQLVNELGMIIASTDVVCVNPEDVPAEFLAKEREVEMGKEDLKSKPEAVRAKIVEGRIEKIKNTSALVNQDSLRDPTKKVSDIVKETIATVGENIKIRRFEKFKLGEGLEKRTNDFAAEVAQQTQAKAPAAPKPKEEPKKEEPAKPTINVSATLVKQLRDKTGAGMMDCKKALAENNGDMDVSVEWLRMKGLASADKKAGRVAAEGVIAAYIHPGSRLGVLLEVNCETDFVAASDGFNKLVGSIAMGIAAAQGVQYVAPEDIPADVIEREKQIEMGREDIKSKPEAIRAKIAEGRANKLAQEMCVLNQPYLLDNSKTVADAVKEAIATIGEKISIRRFVKFQLGEGLEKKSNDFAAEVAAVTGQK